MLNSFKFPFHFTDGEFVDSGGSVPPETPATQIIPDAPSAPNPDANQISEPSNENLMQPDKLDFNAPIEIPAKKVDGKGEIIPKPEDSDIVDFSDDVNFLKELGPEYAEYENIEDALVSMNAKNKEFSSSHEKNQRVIDQINSISKALGTTPDALVDTLGALTPENIAQQSPSYEGVESFMKKYEVSAENVPYYKDLTNSLAGDIMKQTEAQNARAFNSLYGEMQELKFEHHMNKFLQNPDNAEFKGRNQEIWHTLQNELPHMIGKSNAVDVATRYIKAGKSPVSVEKKANNIAKKRLQDIQAKKRQLANESPGRSPDEGKLPSSHHDMTAKQLGAEISKREARGEGIAARRR